MSETTPNPYGKVDFYNLYCQKYRQETSSYNPDVKIPWGGCQNHITVPVVFHKLVHNILE